MKKKSLEIAEKYFVIIGLTFFTAAFDIGLTLSTGPLLPTFITTGLRYFIWLTSLLLICLNWKDALRTASQDKTLWILTLIILLSFIWSRDIEFTLKNSREVLQMTSFSLYFATRFSLKQQVRLIACTFAIGALLSIVCAVTLPSVAIHQVDHVGAWRGIYDYKNTFGSMMIISSIAFFCLPIDKPQHRLYKWAGISLSLTMILLSTSKTSLVVYFLIILILLFYRNFRWRGKITVVFLDLGILVLGCVATLVISNWVDIISGLGRDPTLTGRTILWSVILLRLNERPWLGFGRGAYWAPGSTYAREAGQALGNGFIAPHAHNGFIDFALDVGFIGLSLFLLSYVTAFGRALKRAYATNNSEDLWPLAFLIFLAMNNMTESYLLRLTNIYWVLYVSTVLSVVIRKQPSQLKTG
ncbi:MAG: O-antigen ligase family protein [Hassallia sp. WJT32-NPBG1]|jgi:O-antigen ligase|nr:O-antigen ligase family protein [Hassallia sp. WJT32-NPBG1]